MPTDTRTALPGFLRGQQPKSFAIRDAVYLPERRELQITFMSGRTYAYSDVPKLLYESFLASPSRGAFFSIAIRGRFQFREIPAPTPATKH